MPDFVYLASASPRRRELLTQIGVAFELLAAEVDESAMAGERADGYVTRLALAKAAAGARASGATRPVLAADTTVVLDGRILGKPRDRDEGERMLRALSARTHEVLTAVAVALPMAAAGASGGAFGAGRGEAVAGGGEAYAGRIEWRLCRSEVTFGVITAAQAHAYWDTGEACDKAGGYAIQGLAAVFVKQLVGSYSGVMGLPLYETAELLQMAGVIRWR